MRLFRVISLVLVLSLSLMSCSMLRRSSDVFTSSNTSELNTLSKLELKIVARIQSYYSSNTLSSWDIKVEYINANEFNYLVTVTVDASKISYLVNVKDNKIVSDELIGG